MDRISAAATRGARTMMAPGGRRVRVDRDIRRTMPRPAAIVLTLVAAALLEDRALAGDSLFFRIDAPTPGQLVVSTRPSVRVGGRVSAAESDENFDVVIVIDRSQSTAFSTEEDIDLNGVISRSHSNDSIYMAEHIAARLFSQSMAELNTDPVRGPTIRLGLVTFAGEYREGDSFKKLQGVRRVRLSSIRIRGSAKRNARLESPLSGDFSQLHRNLARTALYQYSGGLGTYTDFIAGLGRAVQELDENGRRGARKVILFLTDGDPTLPVNRHVADDLARKYAGSLAGQDIRVNTFGIGPRARPDTLKFIAAATGGSYSRVRSPAKILRRIRQRSISTVRRGNVLNWAPTCTGPRARFFSTAGGNVVFNLDGSFSADVPLRVGPNCIAVVIETATGERHRHMIPVQFEYPPGYAERILRELRIDMQTVRAGQRQKLDRRLWVGVDPPAGRARRASPLPILGEVEAP